ncbi:MAG: regulatory protein RecX [Pseudonocardiaceae bacterium]
MAGCRAGYRWSGSSEDSRDTRAAVDPTVTAREVCLRLLTVRPRSRAELADALRRRGIGQDVAEPVLDRLTTVGLVDDVALAETAVHSGHTYRGLGRLGLSDELRRKGVPDDLARDAVATVRPEDEEQRARELVRRSLRSATTRDEATLARRLVVMLARKGYPEELAFCVVRAEVLTATGSDIGMSEAESGSC